MASYGHLAASCFALLLCSAAASPVEEVFVNYAAEPNGLWFSWATNTSDESIVQFGTTSNLGQSFTGPARKKS